MFKILIFVPLLSSLIYIIIINYYSYYDKNEFANCYKNEKIYSTIKLQ